MQKTEPNDIFDKYLFLGNFDFTNYLSNLI